MTADLLLAPGDDEDLIALSPLRLRLRLYSNGWVPLAAPRGTPGSRLKGWPKILVTEAEICSWPSYFPDTTLRCDNLATFDIDGDRPALTAAIVSLIEARLGPTPFRRVGNVSRATLVYRWAGGALPRRKMTRKFLLAEGGTVQVELKVGPSGQFNAYGTHPKTGRTYDWPGAVNPLTHRPDAAPVATTAVLERLLEEQEQLVSAAPGASALRPPRAPSSREPSADAGGPLPSLSEMRDMVMVIPADDYDVWWKVGIALRRSYGELAEDLWHEWSAMSDKYKPEEAAGMWLSFAGAAEPEQPITVATIVYLARENGHVPPPDFDPVPQVCVFRKLGRIDLAALKPNDNLFNDEYERATVSVMAGNGGAGKSFLTVQEAVAMTIGRDFLYSDNDPVPRRRVGIVTVEDDLPEIHRRMAAIIKAFEITEAEQEVLAENLFLVAGEDAEFALVTKSRDVVRTTEHYAALREGIRDRKLDVNLIDPLGSFLRGLNENDSGDMGEMIRATRFLARDTSSHACLIAHSPKADPRQIRGNSSIRNGVRRARVLSKVPGVPGVVQLDLDKANYSEDRKPVRFRWERVDLPGGISRGILRPVSDRSSSTADNAARLAAFLEALRRGTPLGEAFSPASGSPRYIGKVNALAGLSNKEIDALVARSIADGLVRIEVVRKVRSIVLNTIKEEPGGK